MEHHPIENLSVRHSCDIVCKYMVHKLFRIASANEHLAHMRNVKHSDVAPDGVVLIDDVRVLNRHYESSERTHLCSESDVAVIETGFLFRIVVFHYLTKVLQVIGLLCYSLYYFNKSILRGKQSV